MKAVRPIVRKQEEEDDEDIYPLTEILPPTVRYIGSFNGRGLMTLAFKEVYRFMRMPGQAVISPLITTVLFYAVFAIGMPHQAAIGTIPFHQFIVPGLMMLAMAQSAFMNTAGSLVLSKLQKNLVDVLLAPISPLEMTIGYAFGGMVRGLVVGLACLGVFALLVDLRVFNPFIMVYYAVMGSLMMSLIGLITGIWGDKFEHMGSVNNFVIMPATFLSGTFFSVWSLPESWQFLCFANPVFYMIDGFRFGLVGMAEGSLVAGMGILFIVNMILVNIAYWMFANGSFLKK